MFKRTSFKEHPVSKISGAFAPQFPVPLNHSGASGDDLLLGSDAGDAASGKGGNDTLLGMGDRDTLAGNMGDDLVTGGRDSDYLTGEAGNDTILGGHGYDRIDGGSGHDTLVGGRDGDSITGGQGDDLILVARGEEPEDFAGAYVFFGDDQLAEAYAMGDQDESRGGANGRAPPTEYVDRVAGIGDLNGDGIDDVILTDSSLSHEETGGSAAGGAYVIFGTEDEAGLPTDLERLNGSDGFLLTGPYGHHGAVGELVAGGGDINGDGIDDLVIGMADAFGSGIVKPDKIYIVFGTSSKVKAEFDLSSLDGTSGYVIETASPQLSHQMDTASAGDLNNDGHADIVITTGGTESVSLVVFGGAENLAAFDARDGTVDGHLQLDLLYPDEFLL